MRSWHSRIFLGAPTKEGRVSAEGHLLLTHFLSHAWSTHTMSSKPRLHKQRLLVLLVAAAATVGSFIPLGRVPAVWTLHGIETARLGSLGLFAATALAVLVGRRDHEMRLSLQIASLSTAGLVVAFCVFRFIALGSRSMPVFEDDDPRAGAYYTKACDAGLMAACARLGTCYWTGGCGVVLDGHRGYDLNLKACEGGDMPACGQLGVCYEFGGCGLPKNNERAVALYEKACGGGEASMCNNLGVCYHKGQCGLGQDDTRAAELYRKACRGGDSSACHNLDVMKN